jgi:hypothetical protein
MSRQLKAALLAATFLFAASGAIAHEEFRVVGTIERLDPEGIAVKTTEGKTITVRFGAPTRFWRGEERAPEVQLRRGESVEVRAWGDTVEDLLALEVMLAPAK